MLLFSLLGENMNQIVQLIIRLYAGLVRLYPLSFRAEYGDEMQAVFIATTLEVEKAGWPQLLSVFFREIRD